MLHLLIGCRIVEYRRSYLRYGLPLEAEPHVCRYKVFWYTFAIAKSTTESILSGCTVLLGRHTPPMNREAVILRQIIAVMIGVTEPELRWGVASLCCKLPPYHLSTTKLTLTIPVETRGSFQPKPGVGYELCPAFQRECLPVPISNGA
jgi:hypothetical protein